MIPEVYVAGVTTVMKKRKKRRERMGFRFAEDQIAALTAYAMEVFQSNFPNPDACYDSLHWRTSQCCRMAC